MRFDVPANFAVKLPTISAVSVNRTEMSQRSNYRKRHMNRFCMCVLLLFVHRSWWVFGRIMKLEMSELLEPRFAYARSKAVAENKDISFEKIEPSLMKSKYTKRTNSRRKREYV